MWCIEQCNEEDDSTPQEIEGEPGAFCATPPLHQWRGEGD